MVTTLTNTFQTDTYSSIVGRILRIDSVTLGDPKQNYLARYQGQLFNEDSAAAYDQLSEALRPLNVTPLFRNEKGQHVVILLPGVTHPRPSKAWVNGVFFLFTVLSVLLAGALNAYNGPATGDLFLMLAYSLTHLWLGIPFAAALLAILLAHEFGHYLVARYHHTAATLPYFIPLPFFSPFGTMGAVIIQKESHKNKRILLDIGMAGPLAGFIVAIPILLYGLSLSKIGAIPTLLSPGEGFQFEGNSILYLLAKYAAFHQWLPSPATYAGMNPILYWIRYFFTGHPIPMGGTDVMIHPVVYAAWAGLLVTALNLIPAGQLDGGHILHALTGKFAQTLLPIILLFVALLGLVWPGWFLWVVLIFFLGRSYAEPLDQITPLDMRRKILAVICLVIFILVFTPVPQIIVGG